MFRTFDVAADGTLSKGAAPPEEFLPPDQAEAIKARVLAMACSIAAN